MVVNKGLMYSVVLKYTKRKAVVADMITPPLRLMDRCTYFSLFTAVLLAVNGPLAVEVVCKRSSLPRHSLLFLKCSAGGGEFAWRVGLEGLAGDRT